MVATGAVAGASRRIWCQGGWALALGRGRRGGPDTAPALAIALALGLSALLAVVGAAVTPGGPPAPPVTRRLTAGVGAVTGLGPGGPEPAFAALEQAAAAAVGTAADRPASLTGTVAAGILRWAHGRVCSRAVKSRGGGGNSLPRRLEALSGLGRGSPLTSSLPGFNGSRHNEQGAKTAINR